MQTIEYFIKYHSDLLSKMKTCNHYYDSDNPNPYHLENDLYTHTMLVYNRCETKLLQICAILHDIGKLSTREELSEKKYIRFRNHENVSMVLSISMLKEMVKREFISCDEMIEILYIVNYHTILYGNGNKPIDTVKHLPENIKHFISADHSGRICLDDKEPMFEILNGINFVKDIEEKKERTPGIIISVGLPCSGKSTSIRNKDITIISRDKYIEEIGRGNTYNEKWSSLTVEEQKNIDILYMKDFQDAVRERKNIIIDMTNLSIKSRKKFMSIKSDYFKVPTHAEGFDRIEFI